MDTLETPTQTIRLILGDQLNIHHSWFRQQSATILYAMMEVRSETDYTLHHAQKVIALFSAMRDFAELLNQKGHRIFYLKIGDKNNHQSFEANLTDIARRSGAKNIEYQTPDEYRLSSYLIGLKKNLQKSPIQRIEQVGSEHFLSTPDDFNRLIKDKKAPKMESFYRHMRKKTTYLMQDDKPLGGKWNYDAQNREPWQDNKTLEKPYFPIRNESKLWEEIKATGIKTFGNPQAQKFPWPKNRKEALLMLNNFLKKRLENFGQYQDAMCENEPYLFHSLLSFALNTKMISPREVIEKAIKTFEKWPKKQREKGLPAVEGFVRQILGWREYMRRYYDFAMPGFAKMNTLQADASLPSWYWTGKTKMNCLHKSITDSLENAYAHHIQRLMITGNFALLLGVHPDEVDAWYLGIYIDAFDWVERTNTRGMSQYADGGGIATKPYISSARYINKMSDYCTRCHYDKDQATTENGCPFNSLYWTFIHDHQELLRKNHRMAMPVKTFSRFSKEKQNDLLNKGAALKKNVEEL